MSDNEKKETNEKGNEDITKQAKENIPPEVWAQLPDHIKKELDPNYKPPEQKPIFKGASADLNESLNRLRDGFEKIGLTLIGRMGEFATTLERVMMAVARIEKVENLVSEIKYFLKGLQKTLDSINMTLNKFESMDISLELESLKHMLRTSGVNPELKSKPTPPPTKPNIVINKNTSDSTSPVVKPVPPIVEPKPPSQQATESESLPIQDIIKLEGEPKEKIKRILESLKGLLKPSMTYNSLVNNLELTRDAISQSYKWVPTLYDIGKSIRKYKSKKSAVITPEDLNEILNNIDQWVSRILA